MQDKQYAILWKENFNNFISSLSKLHKLAAPVFKGYNNYAFENVRSGQEIALKYIPTILPPKKFFMPVHETLLEYDLSRGLNADAVAEYEEIILFGVHTCDIAGIQCLNMVFSEPPQDQNYLIHKQNIKIIGLECNEYCDEFANCCLMNTHIPDGGYDIFFTDLGAYFIAHINTQAGEEIIESAGFFKNVQTSHLNELASFREKKQALFKNEFPVELDIIPDHLHSGQIL
jgi:sulfhydrogenase subunit beta (sulfur reductase)